MSGAQKGCRRPEGLYLRLRNFVTTLRQVDLGPGGLRTLRTSRLARPRTSQRVFPEEDRFSRRAAVTY